MGWYTHASYGKSKSLFCLDYFVEKISQDIILFWTIQRRLLKFIKHNLQHFLIEGPGPLLEGCLLRGSTKALLPHIFLQLHKHSHLLKKMNLLFIAISFKVPIVFIAFKPFSSYKILPTTCRRGWFFRK